MSERSAAPVRRAGGEASAGRDEASAGRDEGIDYSEIPDRSGDEAFWAAARVGPVVGVPSGARGPSPATGVRFTAARLYVRLADGREIGAPLAWFPRLAGAAPAQRKRWQVRDHGFGVRWPDLDEDVSVLALLGLPD
jgi:Protein of unknown function (DUF2442)